MSDKPIDITKDLKRAERKAKWKKRLEVAKDWWDDNKQYAVVVVPAAVGVVTAGVKVLGKRHNLKLEERNKDMRCYDASLGHYWELKRKLSKDERFAIDRRKKNGERLADILDDLRVLK